MATHLFTLHPGEATLKWWSCWCSLTPTWMLKTMWVQNHLTSIIYEIIIKSYGISGEAQTKHVSLGRECALKWWFIIDWIFSNISLNCDYFYISDRLSNHSYDDGVISIRDNVRLSFTQCHQSLSITCLPDLLHGSIKYNNAFQVAPLCQIIKLCIDCVALFSFLNLLIGPVQFHKVIKILIQKFHNIIILWNLGITHRIAFFEWRFHL